MIDEIIKKINDNFQLTEKEKALLERCLVKEINLSRFLCVVETMVEYHTGSEVLVAFALFQFSKVQPELAEANKKLLTKAQQKLFDIFKILRDVSALTRSGEAEEIRHMFVAICQDMRVVIVKFATILFDLKQIHAKYSKSEFNEKCTKNLEKTVNFDEKTAINAQMSKQEHDFVQMISDIFAPLAERLGLSKFKSAFEDLTFELLEPQAFFELANNALMEKEANQKQFEITGTKLREILAELKIEGEIQSRQKHFFSVYKKLVKKNITLGKIYDLLAMRVLVPTVEDCYSVFGKIHAIYKPMAGRVKDYIANPKPNGYQSLHTTIIADNNRPLEIQIRTFEMHKNSEYGVAAHWIYKEKSRAQNKFDQKMTWFRKILENSKDMSSDEFLETLKMDLYGESIFVQTPKGKVMEFPLGSTVIDFAYAIHSQVGNTCVGGKINGKIVPIMTTLSNGDVVEILTNQSSKGPSRDWLLHVKTTSARSKIRAFFKSELKEENIKIGKSILEQVIKARNINLSKEEKERFLLEIASNMMIETLDSLYAEIGAGSLAANSIVGRLLNLYNKQKAQQIKTETIRVKKNKDGILVDGDSGLLVRYAGCCAPVAGEEIVGYISRGRGVTIHRKECVNLKYLEEERLIKAEWQDNILSDFVAVVKVTAENRNEVTNNLNTAARGLKNKLKGFGYKEAKGDLEFEIVVQISGVGELEKIMKSFEGIKHVKKVERSA